MVVTWARTWACKVQCMEGMGVLGASHSLKVSASPRRRGVPAEVDGLRLLFSRSGGGGGGGGLRGA